MNIMRAPHRTERPRPTRPELRVVDAPARRRAPHTWYASLFLGLLFVWVFGIVGFQAFLVQTQSHLDGVNERIAQQEERHRALFLETRELESPDRIVTEAQERLGMIPVDDVVYLEPRADDDERAAFDPAAEPPPVTTTTPATTTPATTTPTTAWKPPATTTPTTAWSAPATTTPTTAWSAPAASGSGGGR